MEAAWRLFIAVAVIAFLCEYMDASLGMGYGTTLTPLLLIIGFTPIEVVPAVLLGQLAGGVVAGYFHHRLGNIKLDFNHAFRLSGGKGRWRELVPWSLDAKVALLLAVCGMMGAIIGVTLAVNISEIALRLYIGAMILGIGITILLRRNHSSPFSWKRLIGVGLLSAFNKGMSGGGYGPLVTGGQLLSGRGVKNSIGCTTVAEVAVCIVSFLTYILLLKGGISWQLALSTAMGSVMAGPLAAFTVKNAETGRLKLLVGLVITALGAWTLARIFV